jgi:hypothetical protein
MIGRRDCQPLRLLPGWIKAKSFTIDGEAWYWGPMVCRYSTSCADGRLPMPRILWAFDLIERDGEDMRNRSFLDRKATLARLLRNIEAGILFNEHLAEDGLAQKASLPSESTAPEAAAQQELPCSDGAQARARGCAAGALGRISRQA